MRTNFGVKPYVYPMPVFIVGTYNEDGSPNAMNAAWGGISEANQLFICMDPEHKTAENIKQRKAYTVSMGTVDQYKACDYVGIASGNDTPDKMEKSGFHAEKSEFVDAPLFKELPMAVECKLISFDEKTCFLLGEIVNVCADESILTDGKVDPKKLRPIVYDSMNHDYYSLGKKVGNAHADGNELM